MSKNKCLAISVTHADQLESKLYEIESTSLAMEEVLTANIGADSALLILGVLRKALHQSFTDCTNLMDSAQILMSARKGGR
jgi:hypothetical protein